MICMIYVRSTYFLVWTCTAVQIPHKHLLSAGEDLDDLQSRYDRSWSVQRVFYFTFHLMWLRLRTTASHAMIYQVTDYGRMHIEGGCFWPYPFFLADAGSLNCCGEENCPINSFAMPNYFFATPNVIPVRVFTIFVCAEGHTYYCIRQPVFASLLWYLDRAVCLVVTR